MDATFSYGLRHSTDVIPNITTILNAVFLLTIVFLRTEVSTF